MALNFTSKAVEEVMYNITIEGHVWTLNEANTQKIIDILNGMSTMASAPQKPVNNTQLHMEPEKPSKRVIEGKKIWQENFIDVVDDNGSYRVYMNCPIPGDKGKYIREKIKAEFKSFGAKWSGNIDKNIVHWTFSSKEEANNYIAARKKAAKERA